MGSVKDLNELIQLKMFETFCLPILMLVIVAIKLSSSESSELNAGWNSIYRRIFRFNKCIFAFEIWRVNISNHNFAFANIMKLYCCSLTFKLLCSKAGLNALEVDNFSSLPIGSTKSFRLLSVYTVLHSIFVLSITTVGWHWCCLWTFRL